MKTSDINTLDQSYFEISCTNANPKKPAINTKSLKRHQDGLF